MQELGDAESSDPSPNKVEKAGTQEFRNAQIPNAPKESLLWAQGFGNSGTLRDPTRRHRNFETRNTGIQELGNAQSSEQSPKKFREYGRRIQKLRNSPRPNAPGPHCKSTNAGFQELRRNAQSSDPPPNKV